MEFGGHYFLRKARKNGEDDIADSLYEQLWNLYNYFHTGKKNKRNGKANKDADQKAFKNYYTDERKIEISKLLKEDTTDLKHAKKGFELAVTLVYTASVQLLW